MYRSDNKPTKMADPSKPTPLIRLAAISGIVSLVLLGTAVATLTHALPGGIGMATAGFVLAFLTACLSGYLFWGYGYLRRKYGTYQVTQDLDS
jgi:hypothetical protein